MSSQDLKAHHGRFIELEFAVETADEIAVSRENARRSEKSDVVLLAEIAF